MTANAAAVEVAAAVLGARAQRDVPVGPLTTYRVGGAAALFFCAESVDDLRLVAAAVAASAVPTVVLGRGSNTLVADGGYPGLVVTLGPFATTVDIRGTTVVAGGAVLLPVLARRTAAAGLTGCEWMVGIPGTVGGAVRMNAGGHGSDMAAVLERARVIDLRTGRAGWRSPAELHLGYRSSALGSDEVVVAAELRGRPGDRRAAEALIDDIVRWRRVNQPGGQNAGSVFTNPPGDAAGRLIEHAGLKGLRIGTASVSTKHANFVQADEGGSADDVLAVVRAVRDAVVRTCGVELRTEIRLIGFPDTYPHRVGGGGGHA